jgi:hypothetical protein
LDETIHHPGTQQEPREIELKDLIDLDIRQMHLDCCGTAQLIIDGLW